MEKYSTAVIGGGAAGICAAINQSRRGESVVICEKLPQLGKKILASGDGRCNLLNDELDDSHYNPAARNLVKSIFKQVPKNSILDFFNGLGLRVYSKEGRIFPVTNQAASVLRVLELELKRLSVPVEFDFNCSGIVPSREGLVISANNGQKIICRKAIITGGGKTYPAFGSDGSLYEIARQLGHTIIEPVPAAVPLLVRDDLCQILQGQRIPAGAMSVINGREGREIMGELLFTKYGLSGTCILDTSEDISVAINRHRQSAVFVAVDIVPFMDKALLREELFKRKKDGWSAPEMLVGILPNKFASALKALFEKDDVDAAVESLKNRRFKVEGTRGWNEAEFTSGGVNVNEVDAETLESKFNKGIYFAGEILDVNGKRGGYNLAWAWASGLVAGQTR